MRKKLRFICLLGLLAALFCVAAPSAAAADYDAALTDLAALQGLAKDFIAENNSAGDPIVLTLSYTRVGDYNTSMWQMTAGARDPEFENYVAQKNSDLTSLQGMGEMTLPDGTAVDFGHLLASMNLVYNGIPITGSWGGDCMQLVQTYQGQADGAAAYTALMAGALGAEDSSTSKFGAADLRADLDSINIGSGIQKDSDLADAIRSYYGNVSDYTRCQTFIGLSFGSVDTGSQDAFRQTVYNTLIKDTGMQFLLYLNNLWTGENWTISPEAEAPMQGACYAFADYLANAVNHEKVKSASSTLMVSMGGDALASALSSLGYGDAASAAQRAAAAAGSSATAAASASNVTGTVSNALDGATQTLRGGFNVTVFQTVLLVMGGAAVVLLLVCVVMLIRRR